MVSVLVIVAVAAAGFSLIDSAGGEVVSASALIAAPQTNIDAFERALTQREWNFPRDHGAHESFQTEWWYYTGNLTTTDNRRFGYQFTIFRRAITPADSQTVSLDTTTSEWRSNQIYLVHFTLSDIESGQFYHDQRYSRGGAELADALPNDKNPDARYQVYLENWSIEALDDAVTTLRIQAKSDWGFGVDFTLENVKSPVFQGENGLSAKGSAPGNASYYYSLPRATTTGTITVNGESFEVSGLSWMDHEFSTGALAADTLGWDWFGLQFEDGRDLMIGSLRFADGDVRAYGGSLIDTDGTVHPLGLTDFTIQQNDEWTSPHTGAAYPSGWTITLNADAINAADDLVFTVTPLMLDQELHSGDIIYWEGAVELSGDVTGYGYTELTGYATTLAGRF